MLVCKCVGMLSLAVVGILGAGVAQATVTIDLVPVGNAGNANDPATGYGQVNYNYNIGKYDVTAGQYCAFLNAVAKTDTYGLYNSSMGSDIYWGCGIAQSGSSGNYTYTTTRNSNYPVNYVSFWDSCRFTNWLQNGQPTNVGQVAGTTETGAYDLTNPTAIAHGTVTRSAGTTWAVASENEWYKAAYYDSSLKGGAGGYWLYPTRSNTAPSNVLSASGTNNANYYDSSGTGNGGWTDPMKYLTPVGYFAASPSAYGTYDQGGDVWQWDDTIIDGSLHGLRGGSFGNNSINLQSGIRFTSDPTSEINYYGFRVSQVPEPTTVALLALGVTGALVRRRATK